MSLRSTLVACAAAVLLLAVGATRAQAATPCPTFQVLHDDRVGALLLPAGTYGVTVKDLTCAQSTRLFAEFLQDYDGVLPKPWKTIVTGKGKGTFSRAGGASFSVALSS